MVAAAVAAALVDPSAVYSSLHLNPLHRIAVVAFVASVEIVAVAAAVVHSSRKNQMNLLDSFVAVVVVAAADVVACSYYSYHQSQTSRYR